MAPDSPRQLATVVVAVDPAHRQAVSRAVGRDSAVSGVRDVDPAALGPDSLAGADCVVVDRLPEGGLDGLVPIVLVGEESPEPHLEEVTPAALDRVSGFARLDPLDPGLLRSQVRLAAARGRLAGDADGDPVDEAGGDPVDDVSGDPIDEADGGPVDHGCDGVAEAGNLFEALVERSSDVLMLLDETGTIRYLSPSVERVLGWEPASMVGEDVFEYIHPDDRDAVREPGDVEDPGVDAWVRFHMEAADGDWHVVEARGSDRATARGVEGYIVNARDVTEQAARRATLERQNERLERFASIVSHDLRNPLNVAQGNLELAMEDDPPAALTQVEASLARMERLVGDLLDLARQGEVVTEFEPVDVAEAASAAWGGVETADSTLVIDGSRTVEADPERLRELFENLFRNAVEHGGPAVTVTVGSDPAGFFVADDGPGIAASDREAVFDRGFTTTGDGTGIGLAIVAEIADAHGWSVEAGESEDGGARFAFRT